MRSSRTRRPRPRVARRALAVRVASDGDHSHDSPASNFRTKTFFLVLALSSLEVEEPGGCEERLCR